MKEVEEIEVPGEGNVPVYFIPGLGIDRRVFFNIKIESRTYRHIDWLEPHKGESFEDYCKRMAAQIHENGPVDLIGLSIGGVIAQGIAQHIPVRRIFLLCSIKSHKEKPLFFKIQRYLPLYLTNQKWIRDRTTWFWGRFFGLYSKDDVELFYKMMPGLSDHYMRWAVRALVKWRQGDPPAEIIHIHGDKDRIFPHRRLENVHTIDGATHSMVVTHGKAVSHIINRYMDSDRIRD